MSDGRGKNLNVENFFNQSPEFYEVINNHGHQGHQYGNQQQWNYSQYSQEYEFDPQFNDVHDRGGYYPKPAYHEMHQQRQISQRQRPNPQQMQYPMQDMQDYGHGHGPYVPHQPFYQHQQFNQPQHQQQPLRGAQRGQIQQRPPMQQRQIPQQQAYMQPHQYYQDMNYDMNGDHVDYNQTEELTSMLNILGLQLAEEQDEQQVEGEDNFISKQIVLLDNGQLKVFYKNQEGSYFSNEQTYGQGLTKAVVDRSGKHIAVCDEDSVTVFLHQEGRLLQEVYRISSEKTKELWFSSTGRFLSIYSKKDKLNCLNVIDLISKCVVYEKTFDGVVQKEQFPFIKFFRNDELALFHSKPDELKILTPMAKFKCNQTVKIEPCDYIQLSTNTLKTQLAFVTKHNDSNEQRRQGRLVLVNFPYFSEPVLDQTFQRAHELKLRYSDSGEDLLVQTSDFIDETGRSYYGKNSLYLFRSMTGEFKPILAYAGPIHSFIWFPAGGKFIVQSGFMPAHTVIYTEDGDPMLQLGVHHRNTLRFSPLNRFLLVGGFENLKGEIDVWDMIDMKQVSTCVSHHASRVEWAPDGRHFFTAIVEQTLRVSNEVNVFKYNGSMVEKLECAANKLNEVIWLPGNFKVDKGSSLFVDKPPTPKNEAADKKEEDDKPKKKKMNLKWDEEADIFHKTEGMKPIGAEELLAFNKIYNDELNAKVQKEKDAADKLEKKIAKAAESGKEGLVQVKGPTVLQRGTFKRGEKVEKDPVLAQGDKDGGSQTDKAIKKGDGPEAANKGQKNDKVENQPKKQKKDKDQIKNPDDLSKNGQAEQKKPQPQKGPNQANPNKQSKKETKDQTPSQKCDSQSNQEKSVLTMTPTAEGGDLKTVNNQRKKKPKAQNKKQPQQGDQGLQNLGQFLSMNFDPSIVQNFHNPNMPPQGYYPNFPQGGFQMGQNSLMNPNFQGRENFFQQDNMPYETANFYPNLMQQMPFYGRQQSRGSTDMDFDLGANTNQIDELQLRKMLNLGPQIGNNKQYTDSQKSKGNSK